MKDIPSGEPPAQADDELQPEYHFDDSKARPNRFATSFLPGNRLVSLDPDIVAEAGNDDRLDP